MKLKTTLRSTSSLKMPHGIMGKTFGIKSNISIVRLLLTGIRLYWVHAVVTCAKLAHKETNLFVKF